MNEKMRLVFVLKESGVQENRYLGETSVQFIKSIEEYNEYDYSYSLYITNGFNTYGDRKQAEEVLSKLKLLMEQVQLNKKIHVVEIDLYRTLIEEGLGIGYPYVHEVILTTKGTATSVA